MEEKQMETTKTQNDIPLIENEIAITRNKIYKLNRQLSQQNLILFELEKEMFRLCEHKWVIDDSVFDSHSRAYKCLKCGLSR